MCCTNFNFYAIVLACVFVYNHMFLLSLSQCAIFSSFLNFYFILYIFFGTGVREKLKLILFLGTKYKKQHNKKLCNSA